MQAAEHVAPARAVEALVNEEVLVQSAEKAHMEREAAVAQAIEAWRRRGLAHAFAERDFYPKPDIFSNEAREFYSSNPILFEKRKRSLLKDFFFEEGGIDRSLPAALEDAHSDSNLRGPRRTKWCDD